MDCSLPGSSLHGDSPGKNTGAGCHTLLQGIFPTQGSNPGLLHCRQILYHLSHQGSPRILEWVAYPFSRGSSWPRKRTGVSCTAGRFFTSWEVYQGSPSFTLRFLLLFIHQIHFSICYEFPLEKAMAPHSSTLAWKIPRMEKPGRLQSMGSQRVGHDWAISLYFTLF